MTSERACQCGNMDVQSTDVGVRGEDGNELAEFWVDLQTGELGRGACPNCGSVLQMEPPWVATWHPAYTRGV